MAFGVTTGALPANKWERVSRGVTFGCTLYSRNNALQVIVYALLFSSSCADV